MNLIYNIIMMTHKGGMMALARQGEIIGVYDAVLYLLFVPLPLSYICRMNKTRILRTPLETPNTDL